MTTKPNTRPPTKPPSTFLINACLTSAAVWEAMLDDRQSVPSTVSNAIESYREEHGACATRQIAVETAIALEQAYKALPAPIVSGLEALGAWDWDIIPNVIAAIFETPGPPDTNVRTMTAHLTRLATSSAIRSATPLPA